MIKNRLSLSFIVLLSSSILFFSFNFAIAKILGSKTYGEINYILSFLNIFMLFININYSSLYMGSKILSKDYKTFELFITTETVLFTLLFIPFYIIFKSYFDSTLVIIILFASYLNVIVSTIELKLNTDRKIISSIFISSLLPKILLILFFILFYLIEENFKSRYYIYSFLGSYFLISLYYIYKFKPVLYFNFKILERAWKFYILGIVGTSYIYLAQIFEKEFGSFEQLATLSISLLILSGLNLFGTVLVKYILPKAHKFWLSRDMKSLSKLYNNNTFIEILVTLPIYIIILINLEYIAYLLGDGFNNLKVVFYILSFGYMIDLLTGITGTLLRVTENEIYEIWNEIIRFIIGMVLIFILKDYKYGVIVSISISSFIYNFIKFIEVYRVLGLTPLNKSQIKLLVKYFSIYVVFLFLIIFSIDTILVTFVLELTTVLIFFYYVFKILIKDKTILGVYS